MSRENVELCKRAYAAFNEDGLPAATEFWDPEIEWHTDPLVPEPGVYKGVDAVRTYFEGFMRAFAAMRIEIDDTIDLGQEEVLLVLTLKGQLHGHSESDTRTQVLNWCNIATVRDGKLFRNRSFFDKERALQAAGLE
jgi:ketosteroid isomerase-like protein